jgi:hypothetical protein
MKKSEKITVINCTTMKDGKYHIDTQTRELDPNNPLHPDAYICCGEQVCVCGQRSKPRD